MDNSSPIQTLELPETVSNIYWSLLDQGPLTTKEISLDLSLSQSKVKEATQILQEKGLALKVEERPSRYLFIPPYSQFVELLRGIKNRTESLVEDLRDELGENIEETLKPLFSLKNTLSKVVDEFEKTLENLKNTTQRNVKSIKELFRRDLEGFSKSLSNLKTTQEELKETLKAKISDKFETSTENVNEKIASELKKLKETIQTEINTIEERNKKLRETIGMIEETDVQKIQETIHRQVKESEGKINQSMRQVKERKREMKKDITKLCRLFEEEVNEGFSDLQKNIIEIFDTFEEDNKWKIEPKSGALQEMVRGLKKQIDSHLNQLKSDFKDNIANLLENHREQVDRTFKNLESKVSEELSPLAKKTDKTVRRGEMDTRSDSSSIQNKVKKVEEKAEEHLFSARNALRSELRDLIEKQGKELTTHLSKINGKASESEDKVVAQIENFQDEIYRNIDSLQEELSTTLTSLSEKLENEVMKGKSRITKEVGDKVERNIKEIESPLEPSIKKTREILERIQEKELEGRKIWLMKGLDRIKAYMKDAFSRAERIVLIVTPDPTYLPLEELSELKRTVSLRIAMGYDQFNYEHRKAKGIVSKLKRVKLRRDEKKLVFGIIIDDEEGFFAPVTEKEEMGELLAMTTNAREWILAFHDILQYSWSLARRIEE